LSEPTYILISPSDLVWLTVTAVGYTEHATSAGANLVVSDPQARLIVEFPAQHTVETVLDPAVASAQARLAGPSSLHFHNDGQPITLSVSGILSAMNRLVLIGRQTRPAPGDPNNTLELPWRVQLGLDQNAQCVHRVAPPGQVTELWHSRIVRADNHNAYAAVYPLQVLASDDPGFDDGQTPLGGSFGLIDAQIKTHPGQPMSVDELILSGCGAWFSGSISWPAAGPPVAAWTHRVAMGRDFYVRVLVSGVLFPFGHKAAYVQVSERVFPSPEPQSVAALRTTSSSLMITEPARDNYDFAERQFPFQRVDLGPQLVTDLTTPAHLDQPWWPMRNGAPIKFSVRARVADQVVEMALPLLFSPLNYPADQLAAIYAASPSATPGGADAADAGGQTTDVRCLMPILMKTPTEAVTATVHQVNTLTFGGKADGGTGFHPVITGLTVGLPAVKKLLNQDVSQAAQWSSQLLDRTVAPDQVDTLLQFPTPLQLTFGGQRVPNPATLSDAAAAALNTGVVAAPNMIVNQLSRSLGPSAANTVLDPRTLFDDTAKLFGVVRLIDLIKSGSSLNQPKLTWSGEPPSPTAHLQWTETHLQPSGPFAPGATSQVSLNVTATASVAGPLTVTTDGVVTDFALNIPSSDPGIQLLALTFTDLTFHAVTGALPKIDFHISGAQFTGALKFLQDLQKYLPSANQTAPMMSRSPAAPSALVGIRADDAPAAPSPSIALTYVVGAPEPITLAVFTLTNLLLKTTVTVSLVNEPVLLEFAFASREQPFLVAVSVFGGGGYIDLAIGAGGPSGGLQRFTGAFEFGACAAMDFVVVSAEVHVFGGVVLTLTGSSIDITGYLRIGGRIRLLGLISISLELTMALTCDFDSGVVSGSAQLVITVDLTFWSTSVHLECHQTFTRPHGLASGRGIAALDAAGADAIWSINDALGHNPTDPTKPYPWLTYCQAFA
jgi:hypothetical protein